MMTFEPIVINIILLVVNSQKNVPTHSLLCRNKFEHFIFLKFNWVEIKMCH